MNKGSYKLQIPLQKTLILNIFSSQLILYYMVIQLYIDFISQPSRTVLAFCKISNIQVQVKEVRIAKLEHLAETYESINPMKKVPAIVDTETNLALGQSHAIINYLTRKYKLQALWGLGDEIKRAKIDQYTHYHHQNTRKCALLLYAEVFSKLYPVQNGDYSSRVRQDVKLVLDFIEQHYFKEASLYMIGKFLTVADLSAYFQIQSLIVVDYDLQEYPKIAAWLTHLSTFPAIKQTNYNFLRLLPKIKQTQKSSL